VVRANIIQALRLKREAPVVLEVEVEHPPFLLEEMVVVVILLQQAPHKVKMAEEAVTIHKLLAVAVAVAVLMDK
tara:strand:+ start:225 stop:446 length:222 start_codon:yes stop_codon:yes gene_type:complete